MMWFLKLALMLAGCYAVVVAIAYALQTWLIFPAGMVGGNVGLPQQARYTELQSGDGERVVWVRIPAAEASSPPRPLLMGFGGNAWNADAMALMLHRIFPEHDIAALHYRGYPPSSGRPSARAIFEDARLGHDKFAGDHEEGVVAVGFSVGASVAVDLASARPVRGLVLVTPFDSLKELAASHYPWLPVRWLLRHRMETAATLSGLKVPTAMIVADNDTVVPEPRSVPVREAAADLRADVTIADTGHNNLYDTADFVTGIRNSVDAVLRD